MAFAGVEGGLAAGDEGGDLAGDGDRHVEVGFAMQQAHEEAEIVARRITVNYEVWSDPRIKNIYKCS